MDESTFSAMDWNPADRKRVLELGSEIERLLQEADEVVTISSTLMDLQPDDIDTKAHAASLRSNASEHRRFAANRLALADAYEELADIFERNPTLD